MNCKLTEYGADDVEIEDVGLRPFFGQPFHGLQSTSALYSTPRLYSAYLGSGNGQKADAH